MQGAGQASLARLGVAYVNDRDGFRQLARQLLWFAGGVGAAALLAAVLLGDVLLGALFHPRFAALQPELIAMMVASVFVYATSAFGYALTAAGVRAGQLAVFGVALTVALATAFPLSAAYGIGGAVASTACGWAAAAVLSGLLLRVKAADVPSLASPGAVRSRAV